MERRLVGVLLRFSECRLGEALGVEGRFYARDFSRPQVFVVDSTIAAEASKSLHTLRDKRISPIDDRDAFTTITLLRDGDLVFRAHRDTSNAWAIAQPEERKAKSWKLNGMLTLIELCEAGLGIAALPAYPKNNLDTSLIKICPLPKFSENNLWILTHKDLDRSKGVLFTTESFNNKLKPFFS